MKSLLMFVFSIYWVESILSMPQSDKQVIYRLPTTGQQISMETEFLLIDRPLVGPSDSFDFGFKINASPKIEPIIKLAIAQIFKNPVGNFLLSRIRRNSKHIVIVDNCNVETFAACQEEIWPEKDKILEEKLEAISSIPSMPSEFLEILREKTRIRYTQDISLLKEVSSLDKDFILADRCLYASSNKYYVLVNMRQPAEDLYVCLPKISPIISLERKKQSIEERIFHEMLHTCQGDIFGLIGDFSSDLPDINPEFLHRHIKAFSGLFKERMTFDIFKDAFGLDCEFSTITGFYMRNDEFMFTPLSEWGYQMFLYKGAKIRQAHNCLDFNLYKQCHGHDFPAKYDVLVQRHATKSKFGNLTEVMEQQYFHLSYLYNIFLKCWNTEAVQKIMEPFFKTS